MEQPQPDQHSRHGLALCGELDVIETLGCERTVRDARERPLWWQPRSDRRRDELLGPWRNLSMRDGQLQGELIVHRRRLDREARLWTEEAAIRQVVVVREASAVSDLDPRREFPVVVRVKGA